ncbi:ATPase [Candidatus Aerophobetes bacterium]|uniref:ATPase n=1 Tax=Aerophobetes bacterium TaxID=2030807 RepID=A0A2A4X384_UNCAE|nr:MAG: ATPase [Candidatus Aerophobetes bacterium]
MTTPALTISNVGKKFNKFKALDSVSFTINPGEIFGLLGPNGAGKTTLISCIVGLLKPSSGHIKIFDYDSQEESNKAKHLLGFVPQELINYGYFTVEKILAFHIHFYGLSKDRDRINFLLHKLSLYKHRKKLVSQLSGGMKRRLLIAKALLHSPRLLLLDEPTAGIDLHLRNTIWSFVNDLKKEKIAILLTTHYLEEAEHLCDRIGIIKNGQLVKVDSTCNLINSSSSKIISLFFHSAQPPCSHPMLIKQTELFMSFNLPNNQPIFSFLKEIKVDYTDLEDIAIKRGRLEDVMHTFFEEEEESDHG